MPAPAITRRRGKQQPSLNLLPLSLPVQPRRGQRRRQPLSTAPAVVITQAHYRRAADTIVEAPDGVVQLWNGIDKPLRFDPAVGVTENVGVLKPTAPMIMIGFGAGPIVGKFTAYVRFVDRSGNFSSLSPVSNTIAPAVTVALISNATNASPIVITTTAAHGLSPNQIVKIAGVYGNNASNGIWAVGTVPTTTTFSLVNGDGSNSVANGTYNSGGTVVTGCASIYYTNVATPTESKVTRRQILRNKDGEAVTYYIDIDTTDLTSTTFISSTTSQSLSNPVSLFDSNGQTLVDKSVPLTYKKFVAPYLGRMFAAGNEPYTEGAVKVTNGSAIVTGIGTEWGQLTFAGRYLTVSGGDKVYTIQTCDSKTQVTLTQVYGGTTDQFAYYTIQPANTERRAIYWSEPAQPEAWPITNTTSLAEDPGAGEFTGLMQMGSWLHVLAESRIYRTSYISNPLLDFYSTTASRRGCVNNRCWVQTEDSAYLMDYRGIHVFSGNDDHAIGTTQIQDLFRPRQTGRYKINWAAKRNFHAVYDPGEGIARWFLTIGGGYAPQHALCYQVRLDRWWIEEYPWPVGSSCTGRLNGKPQVFLGTDAYRIMAVNSSTLDGIDPATGTTQGTVTSSGVDWIKDTAASFASTNMANAPLTIIQGKGKGQRRRIVSVSGAQLSVDSPWTNAPDTTSTYQIGGVTWKWVSGWRKWAPGQNLEVRAAHAQFRSITHQAGTYMKVYSDFSLTAPVADRSPGVKTWGTTASLADGNGIACLPNDPNTDLTIDMTKSNGYVWQRLDGVRESWTDAERFMALEIGGTTNADPVQLQALRIDGVTGGRKDD